MSTYTHYNHNGDTLYDYCHKPYTPHRPIIGKLKSENILLESFQYESCGEKFYQFIETLKTGFGPDNTVWGIKKVGNALRWEFYFYNYDKKDRRVNILNFLSISKKFFALKLTVNETVPYFMFSVDISKDDFKKKRLRGLHIYFNHLSANGGYSYFKNACSTRIENIYRFFHNPKDELKMIIQEIKNALFNDLSSRVIGNILIQELASCKHICVAHKENRESIYYSGITVDQYLFFLKKFEYPQRIIAFIEAHKNDLAHLLYDVGFDYTVERNAVKISKSGYYGSV